YLPSFPTRRSSDLGTVTRGATANTAPPRSVRPTSPEPLMSGCGFVLQHWPDDLDHSLAAGQNLTTGKVEGRVLGIISGQLQQPSLRERVDDPADARPIDGPGTHHAGFGTCVQRRFGQFFRRALSR